MMAEVYQKLIDVGHEAVLAVVFLLIGAYLLATRRVAPRAYTIGGVTFLGWAVGYAGIAWVDRWAWEVGGMDGSEWVGDYSVWVRPTVKCGLELAGVIGCVAAIRAGRGANRRTP